MTMRAEMLEQPEALRRFLRTQSDNVKRIAESLNKRAIDFGYVVARGSSDNAGLYAKYLFGAAHGLPMGMATPSLWTLYDKTPDISRALVLGISQSGASTDLIAVMKNARAQGAATVVITNTVDSALAHASEFVIDIAAGPEHAVAATKSYTSTLLALATLSVAMKDDAEDSEQLRRLPDLAAAALDLGAPAKKIAKALQNAQTCVVIGRGYNFATAHEWSLKLKELAYLVAEPYSSADFRHGPMALVGPGFPVLTINAVGCAEPDVSALSTELSVKKNARLFACGNVEATMQMADVDMPLDLGPEWTSPIVAAIPGQLLSWHLATIRGFDPDSPRGLQKITKTT